jgi:hypothetical protein
MSRVSFIDLQFLKSLATEDPSIKNISEIIILTTDSMLSCQIIKSRLGFEEMGGELKIGLDREFALGSYLGFVNSRGINK